MLHEHGDLHLGAWMMWLGLAAIALLVALAARRLFAAATAADRARGLHRNREALLSYRSDSQSRHPKIEAISEPRDTLFVLPDISGYTRFLQQNRFAHAHAQQIIFELLNALLACSGPSFELSKLEGDAALFLANPADVTPAEAGHQVLSFFRAFDAAKERLEASNLCPCKACTHIVDLDLKVFVHRGEASHFSFRGTTDVFGADAIVLHRLLKPSVPSRRYVMVTRSANGALDLALSIVPSPLELDVANIGPVHADVYDLTGIQLDQIAIPSAAVPEPARPMVDLARKIVRSGRAALPI